MPSPVLLSLWLTRRFPAEGALPAASAVKC
jgi:hypothetical protein